MQGSWNIDGLIDDLAEKVAVRLRPELERMGAGSGSVDRRVLSVPEAATYLGRSETSVRHLIADGVIPTVRIDRRVGLDLGDLDALIERNKE